MPGFPFTLQPIFAYNVRVRIFAPLLFSTLLLLPCDFVVAGSATWKPNPTSGDWNSAANWRPRTIPNGTGDVATFGTSDTTDISLPTSQIEVDGVVFNPDASAFTISGTSAIDQSVLTFSGAGITNNSGVTQTFVSNSTWIEGMVFHNQATAGAQTTLSIKDSSVSAIGFHDQASAGSATILIPGNGDFGDGNPEVLFYDSATADHSTMIAAGGSGDHGEGAAIIFFDSSTAANAAITVTGATNPTAYGGGILIFEGSSTAGASIITNEGTSIVASSGGTRFAEDATAENATITAEGASGPDGFAADVVFEGNSDAENATLIANGGTNGGDGGTIQFWDTSDGGTARIELFGNGALDLSNVADTYLDLGSIEGNGMISLGDRHNISIGTNNLSTTFSGVIEGDSSLGKVGSGTLTLSGANTHTQGTYVSSGFLKVTNRTGSATGTGQVNVYDGGTLGGSGIVGSNLLVHAGGTLAPGTGTTTLTVKKLLDFDGNSNYVWRVKTASAKADKVIGGKVQIIGGALFTGIAIGNALLSPGAAFTAIENTSPGPISGTFDNLPDGGTIKIGNNTFQANYEGGDGNDLTLTVVP